MMVPGPTRVSSTPSVALLMRSSPCRLLGRNAGLRDDLAPLYNFRRDEARQFFRRRGSRFGAKFAELVAHDRIGDRGGDLLVQSRNDVLRRAARRKQRE